MDFFLSSDAYYADFPKWFLHVQECFQNNLSKRDYVKIQPLDGVALISLRNQFVTQFSGYSSCFEGCSATTFYAFYN